MGYQWSRIDPYNKCSTTNQCLDVTVLYNKTDLLLVDAERQ